MSSPTKWRHAAVCRASCPHPRWPLPLLAPPRQYCAQSWLRSSRRSSAPLPASCRPSWPARCWRALVCCRCWPTRRWLPHPIRIRSADEPKRADTAATFYSSATEPEHADTTAASYSATEPELANTAAGRLAAGPRYRATASAAACLSTFRQACSTPRYRASRAVSTALVLRCWASWNITAGADDFGCIASRCARLCDTRQPCSDIPGLSSLITHLSCYPFPCEPLSLRPFDGRARLILQVSKPALSRPSLDGGGARAEGSRESSSRSCRTSRVTRGRAG